jgi:hypothetical protein
MQGCHNTEKHIAILQYMTTVLQYVLRYIALEYYCWKSTKTNKEIHPHVERCPPSCKMHHMMCAGSLKCFIERKELVSQRIYIRILINAL